MSRYFDECFEELSDRIFSFEQTWSSETTRPPKLYHYTTTEGLLGIIQSSSLRATDAKYLNDPNEVTRGKEIIHQTLQK